MNKYDFDIGRALTSHDDCPVQDYEEILYDFRFRALLPRDDWNALPFAVKKRFSKRLSNGQIALYKGVIIKTRFSKVGWVLAQALRLLGAPLPINRDVDCPAAVNVAEDPVDGGQIWTRIYHNHKGFPQTINSAKRFAGITGLEEHIGFGICMALKVCKIDDGLSFTSDHYFWNMNKLRVKLPSWICPIKTQVCHIDRGQGAFDFKLKMECPLIGELLYQKVRFHDV